VLVEDNTLTFNPADVVGSGAAGCTISNLCGFNGLFSNYGTSIYGNTRVGAVTFQQNNEFRTMSTTDRGTSSPGARATFRTR